MGNFKDLKVWQASVDLAVRTFLSFEGRSTPDAWAIADQARRSALSVPNNIAEGFGRDTLPDRRQYLIRARGSLNELETSLIVATRIGLAEDQALISQIEVVGRLLNGLIKYLDRRIRETRSGSRPRTPNNPER